MSVLVLVVDDGPVEKSGYGTFRTCRAVQLESVMRIKADIADAYPGKPVNLPLCGSDGLLRAITLR